MLESMRAWALMGPFTNADQHGADPECPYPDKLFRFWMQWHSWSSLQPHDMERGTTALRHR